MRAWLILVVSFIPVAFLFGQQQPPKVTYGPILGEVTSSTVKIWARTAKPGAFRVRYGTLPNSLAQLSGHALTRLEHDNTGSIRLTALKPDTVYYYRLMLSNGKEDASGLGGSFKTLPTADMYRDEKHNPKGLHNIRFEVGCCNNQTPGEGGGPENVAFKTMHEKLKGKIDFAIQNGDWLYEDKRTFSVKQWREQNDISEKQTPDILKVAPTLAGVWENYKVYLQRSKNLAAWHRDIPTVFTFDDHELLNDIWGAGEPGLRDRRAVFRDIGVRAWTDYLGWANPTAFTQPAHFGRAKLKAGSDELIDAAADFKKLDLEQMTTLHVHWGTADAGVNDNKLDGVGGDPNAGVYQVLKVLDKGRVQVFPAAKKDGEVSYSIGRRNYYRFRIANCDFFCLDTRSHRQMHDTKQPDKEGLSMLGTVQKKWLMDAMDNSDADFFFVVSTVNFMIPHVGGGGVRASNKDDAWTAFLDEREQLIKFFDRLKRPVFVLTGDLHNSFANKITDRVWEFASAPHNSQNHIAADEGGRPANGPFTTGGRKFDIRWSSYFLDDIPRKNLLHPMYCVVQVNNVFNSPKAVNEKRWVAYPRPHVIFNFHDGRTGDLLYAESVQAVR